MERLAPPSWPEDVFGKIDREKAKKGKALFMTMCSGCHNAWPYTWTEPNKYGKRFVLVGLVPQTYVGTDHTQGEASRVIRNYWSTEQVLATRVPGQADAAAVAYFSTVLARRLGKWRFGKLNLTPGPDGRSERLSANCPRRRPRISVYKAAPRDGVWATPPFLHNGSVPNLYEMLVPASERTKNSALAATSIRSKSGWTRPRPRGPS